MHRSIYSGTLDNIVDLTNIFLNEKVIQNLLKGAATHASVETQQYNVHQPPVTMRSGYSAGN